VVSEQGIGGLQMKLWLAVTIALVSVSVGAVAQQNNTFKAKPYHAGPAPKSTAHVGKPGSSRAGAAATSNNLQHTERQTAKSFGKSRSAARTAPALKPARGRSNPPINFGGKGGGGKSAGLNKKGPNPYAGRLKQKSSGGH
jgi:hypothetical protein